MQDDRCKAAARHEAAVGDALTERHPCQLFRMFPWTFPRASFDDDFPLEKKGHEVETADLMLSCPTWSCTAPDPFPLRRSMREFRERWSYRKVFVATPIKPGYGNEQVALAYWDCKADLVDFLDLVWRVIGPPDFLRELQVAAGGPPEFPEALPYDLMGPGFCAVTRFAEIRPRREAGIGATSTLKSYCQLKQGWSLGLTRYSRLTISTTLMVGCHRQRERAPPSMSLMPRAAIATFVLIPAALILQVAAQSMPRPTPPVPALSAPSLFRADRNWSNRRTPTRTRQHNDFQRLAIWSTAAWVADAATTEIGLATTRASEVNPVFGRHPSPARLWGTAIPLQGIFLYACHQDSHEHPRGRFWRIAMKVSIGLHTFGAVNNLMVIR
jgi:hypothetical protein